MVNASFSNLNALDIFYNDESKFTISLANRVFKSF